MTSVLRFRPDAGDNLANIACEAQHPALTREPLRAYVKMFVQCKCTDPNKHRQYSQNFCLFFSTLYSLFSSDPPGLPEIEGYKNKQALKSGETVTLVCISRGGNPLATVTWYKNGVRIDSSYTTVQNGSKNTYEFIASEDDNNAVYSCRAKNDLIVKPLKAEITTIVQCKWC